jgi:hypothetical protein
MMHTDVVHLMTMSSTQDIYMASNDWMIENNELGSMWKEPVVAEFK